jgi:hypothetical protein
MNAARVPTRHHPAETRFHEMRPAPTRAGAAFTKAQPYKSKTRRARSTPTRQLPIVSVALAASYPTGYATRFDVR